MNSTRGRVTVFDLVAVTGSILPTARTYFAPRSCRVLGSSADSSFASASTISRTSSGKLTVGFQPSFFRAKLASPSRQSTSAGRK